MTSDDQPLLRNIFRLAKGTARPLENRDVRSSIRRCKQCDAARPADERLDVCSYCGAAFEAAGPPPSTSEEGKSDG